MDEMQTNSPEDKQQGKTAGRVLSIDALRGFDMFFIIGGERILASLHNVFNRPETAWIDTTYTRQMDGIPFRRFDYAAVFIHRRCGHAVLVQ